MQRRLLHAHPPRHENAPESLGANANGPRLLGWLGLFLTLALGGCLAPPPPILVDTPYGNVRAASEAKASEIAGLLRDLAPQVQDLLPGAQRRPIDVWVQDELRVYRHSRRPDSVRGFTLLSDEFRAKRIHLQEDGQSAWYLSHELVHALIGPTWSPLPGVLEEGLGDVVAEFLNPNHAYHIRAHRLMNASAFTDGFLVHVAYSVPDNTRKNRRWERRISTTRIQTADAIPSDTVQKLFSASRRTLHTDWPEIPESFYGLAWLVTSRIVDRHGLVGLHELCLEATRQGHDIIPLEWVLDAAEIEPEELDAAFLTTCFGPRETSAAAYLQSDLYAELIIGLLEPYADKYPSLSALLYWMDPSFQLPDGSQVRVREVPPLRRALRRRWAETTDH